MGNSSSASWRLKYFSAIENQDSGFRIQDSGKKALRCGWGFGLLTPDSLSSPSPRVHLAVRVLPQILDLEEHASRTQYSSFFSATIPSPAPHVGNRLSDLGTRRSASQEAFQVGTVRRVKAEQPPPVRRQPRPVTGAAERLGGRGDDAEDGAVRQGKTVRRSLGAPRSVRRGFIFDSPNGPKLPLEPLDHLRSGDDLVH